MSDVPREWIEALDRVLELGVLLERDQRESLGAIGLTTSRAHALWVLGLAGPMTHRDLAQALDVVPRSVTDLVDALERLDLVRRGPHPTDGRASVVSLTAAGDGLVSRMREDQGRFAAALFADLPSREVAAFVRTMDRLLATLRPLVPGPAAP